MSEAIDVVDAESPGLRVTIANRIANGEFVVDEEHLSGFRYGDMPAEMTATAVYRVWSMARSPG